jgi:hypothetical protein
MTGSELLNEMFEIMAETGLEDDEIILEDVMELLGEIDIPTEYYPPTEKFRNRAKQVSRLNH